MLDKLVLTSLNSVSIEEACQQLKGHFTHYTITATKYHQQVVVFRRGHGKDSTSHLITLHLGPRFVTVSPMKLEVNPTRFRSFSELCDLLSLFVDVSQLIVTRTDHAVDLEEISVKQLHQSLIYTRKKSREVYKNGVELTGLYIGKSPEMLAVYDKALEKKLGGTRTRVELRQFREKVPVRHFLRLPNIVTYRPFSKLIFQKLPKIDQAGPSSLKESRLRELIGSYGAQGSYKLLNRHSNFKRDYQGLLVRNDQVPDLDIIYESQVRAYFEGDTQ